MNLHCPFCGEPMLEDALIPHMIEVHNIDDCCDSSGNLLRAVLMVLIVLLDKVTPPK